MIRFLMSTVVLVAMVTGAEAQQVPVPRPKPVTKASPPKPLMRVAKKQRRTKRLPRNAINRPWGENCTPSESQLDVAYNADEEIRFRVRQGLGTIMVFPEEVSPMVVGTRSIVTMVRYGQTNPQEWDGQPGRIWQFGALRGGGTINVALLGRPTSAGPTIYVLRVETEPHTSTTCPDLLVRIHGPNDPAQAAGMNFLSQNPSFDPTQMKPTNAGEPISAVPTTPVEASPLRPGVKTPGTGRHGPDWLAGKDYDPARISFDWKVFGEANIAPDVVYSDCCFMYLQYSGKRIDRVELSAIARVKTTGRGKVDEPLDWTIRGNTVVVPAIGTLTLEQEGLVTCIRPVGDLTAPAHSKQIEGVSSGG